MPEAEPSSFRRLAVGVVVIAAAAAGAVVLVRGRDASDDRPSAVGSAPAPTLTPPAAQPTPAQSARPVVLGRAEILEATGAAASAHAEGADTPPELLALAGRRFQLRLPFGCGGPDQTEAWAFWTADGETLRVSVRPQDWTESSFARVIGGEGVEAVEGFWISRPWQTSETCPRGQADPLLAEAPAASPETVGLATVFGPDSSRLARRRDRPYELTLSAEEMERPGPQGLQLILEGRITAFTDGGPVACRSDSPDQRPVCLIGVQLERVAVRNPATDRLLGEWRDAAQLTPPPPPPSSPQGSGATAPPGSAR